MTWAAQLGSGLKVNPWVEKASGGLTTMAKQNLVTEYWQQIGRHEELKNPGHKEVQTIYFGAVV